MTNKIEDPTTSRDIYFNPAGDPDWSGFSPANAVDSPTTAVAKAIALDPAPSGENIASIVASESGLYSDGVDLPEFVSAIAPIARIATDDAITLVVNGFQVVEWGSLSNMCVSGIVMELDDVDRALVTLAQAVGGAIDQVTAPIVTSTNGVVFNITGDTNNIEFNITSLRLAGDGWTGFNVNPDVASPFNFRVDTVRAGGDDVELMHFNPVDGDTTGSMTTGNMIIEGATNVSGYKVSNGTLTVVDGNIEADTYIHVESGGTLVIIGGNTSGDITVDSGGRLVCILQNHTSGTITNNGTIDGIINGRRYGNWINNNYDENNTPATTTSTTPQLIHTFNFSVPHAAEYMIDAEFDWLAEKKDKAHITRIDLDSTPIHEFEQYMGGEDDNADTNIPSSKRRRHTLTAGAHTLEMYLSSGEAGKEVIINDSTFIVEFWEN